MPLSARTGLSILFCLLLAMPLLGPSSVSAQPPEEPESPLLKEPDTPDAAMKATLLMVEIGRPKLARRYLALFDSMMPDDDMLLDLREKYGIDSFLRLANVRELQPQSVRLLDRVNAAFKRRAQDPARVDQLIARLAGTPREQATAIVSIREGGAAIVPRLLQNANNPLFANRRDPLVIAISRIGNEATPPLLGALESTDNGQRALAIEALGWVGKRENLVDLWYAAAASCRIVIPRIITHSGHRAGWRQRRHVITLISPAAAATMMTSHVVISRIVPVPATTTTTAIMLIGGSDLFMLNLQSFISDLSFSIYEMKKKT